jgi:putative inorganic carbon (hco3(-)) transporter
VPRVSLDRKFPDSCGPGLYWSMYAFLVVSYIRPQDIIWGLGLLKPGLIATVLVVVFSLPHIGREWSRSNIFRAALLFFGVLVIGGLKTVNQYFWLQTVWSHGITTVAYLICLPVIMRDPTRRDGILRLLLVAFSFLAFWTVTHHGVGTGSFLKDENDVAAALGVSFCFLAFQAIGSTTPVRRSVTWAGALLCVIAIIVTGSRGGFVGMCAAAIAIAFFSGKLIRAFAAIVVVGVLAYPFLPPGYVNQRLISATNPNDPTRVERLYGWHRGWEMFLDNPVLGVGADNYMWRVGEYDAAEAAIEERQNRRSLGGRAAHSMYFQLLPETGLAGTVLYAYMLLSCLLYGFRVLRGREAEPADGVDGVVVRGAVAAMVSLSASGTFVSVLFYPHFWLLCGLISGVRGKLKAEPSRKGVVAQGAGGAAGGLGAKR